MHFDLQSSWALAHSLIFVDESVLPKIQPFNQLVAPSYHDKYTPKSSQYIPKPLGMVLKSANAFDLRSRQVGKFGQEVVQFRRDFESHGPMVRGQASS